jgi:predicted dehydrogenase
MATLFRGAIIGLGQIGMGYDLNQSSPNVVLTHAKAYASHPRFKLVSALDLIENKRTVFSDRYFTPAFETLFKMMNETQPDVISICTSTESHYSIVKEIISYKPKAIICEKPISFSIQEAIELEALSIKSGVPVIVNYMRRFEPGANRVRNLLERKAIGSLQKGVVFYTKGLFNNASHFIDLLTYWLGAPEVKEIVNKGKIPPPNDLEPDFVLSFSGVDITFMALNSQAYSIAELNLFGELGKLSYLEGGAKIEILKTTIDPNFPGYRIFETKPEEVENDFSRYQLYVLEELAQFLDGKIKTLSSNLETALLTLKIADKVRLKTIKEWDDI